MNGIWQDVRYALRMLVKSPGFTVVVVLAMGLGIGATTMIYSVVNAVVLREPPVPEPERVVWIKTRTPAHEHARQFSQLDFRDVRARARSYQHLGAWYEGLALVSFGGDAERLNSAVVSSGMLASLGLRPTLGREFLPEEEQEGRQLGSVMISHKVWQERLRGDRNVIGTTLRMNSRVRTIVGVLPPGIRFPETADFWIPLAYVPAEDVRNERYLGVLGRLAPGSTLDQARAELATIARGLESEHPDTNHGVTFRVQRYREALADDVRPVMAMLMCAVLFVLLIACANVANLMLARATVRAKEMNLRMALGAGRFRLARQLLTESVLVALLGGALGVLIAVWSNDLILKTIPMEMPWWMKFGVDRSALLVTLAVSVGSGLLFGLAPVVQISTGSLNDSLREGGGHATSNRSHRRMRNGLVIAEIALSVVLLAGAGLMVRSFLRMQEIRDGLQPRGVLTGRLTLPVAAYPQATDRRRFFEQFIPRVAELPGVMAAAGTSQIPHGSSSWDTPVAIVGQEKEPDERLRIMNWSAITPGYFRLIGIPQVGGRDFGPTDGPDAPRVAIVNESAARTLWPGQDPIGQRFKYGARDTAGWKTVVGVVADVRQLARNDDIKSQIYEPHAQVPIQTMTLVVRARSDPGALAAPIRRLVRERDSGLPFYDVSTMSEAIRIAMWEPRLYAQLFGFFSIIALAIAAVGIYGVMAYSVANRTQEIGVRMAMGAGQNAVLSMVMFQGMRLTALGVGIGLAAAFGVTRLMASQLFGVSASDPPTFAGVILILVGSALLACWLPAHRATRVDPMVALRSE